MEADTKSSATKVAYDLRPAKQVERRMMIEALQRLSQSGYVFSEYKYVGFGALTFVDFVLLYKMLGVRRLLTVEHDDELRSRVEFNKPYGEIDTYIGPIYDVLKALDADDRYLVWLDYDYPLNEDITHDITRAARALPIGSVLLVTVDAEPPSKELDEEEPDKPKGWMSYYERQCSRFFNSDWRVNDFARGKLACRNIQMLSNMIRNGIAGRKAEFQPLFSFDYKDGHRMVTVGGFIASDREKELVASGRLDDLPYLRFSLDEAPYRIIVPRVTRRERMYLDQNMPCSDDWVPDRFQISNEDIMNYREIFRFFPAFGELLME